MPIHKKGSKASPGNYRSVSLLSVFGKVLERIVFNELFAHVRPIISDKQHGFLPGRSCATNLCTMLHTAWTNISAGSQTDVIYTDYSSAFQSVNHILLLHKLKNSYRISDKAFDWIGSYLSGREQRVVVAGKCSEWVPVRSGTPEGGLLSPLLFACFVNDLPNSLESDTLMFADDVKMYRRTGCPQKMYHIYFPHSFHTFLRNLLKHTSKDSQIHGDLLTPPPDSVTCPWRSRCHVLEVGVPEKCTTFKSGISQKLCT